MGAGASSQKIDKEKSPEEILASSIFVALRLQSKFRQKRATLLVSALRQRAEEEALRAAIRADVAAKEEKRAARRVEKDKRRRASVVIQSKARQRYAAKQVAEAKAKALAEAERRRAVEEAHASTRIQAVARRRAAERTVAAGKAARRAHEACGDMLLVAAAVGDLAHVAALLDGTALPDGSMPPRAAPAPLAAGEARVGADVGWRDRDGQTALHHAAAAGRAEVSFSGHLASRIPAIKPSCSYPARAPK